MRRSSRRSIIVSRLKALASFSDNFSLSSGMKNNWIALTGIWSSNGTAGSTNTSASSYPISYLKMSKPDLVASVDVSAGTGLTFWVTDSGNWYATSYIQDNYTYDCNPSTSCGSCERYCSWPCYQPCLVDCNPHPCPMYVCGTEQACTTTYSGCRLINLFSGICSGSEVQVNSGGPCGSASANYAYCATPNTTCQTVPKYCNNPNTCYDQCSSSCLTSCSGYSGSQCGYYSCNCSTTYQTCNGVYHLLNLLKSTSGVVSTLTSDISLGATAATIWLQTSGNDITVKAYSDTAKTTQIGTTISHTASNPSRTNTIGIIKVPSDNQANTVDSFTVTVSS